MVPVIEMESTTCLVERKSGICPAAPGLFTLSDEPELSNKVVISCFSAIDFTCLKRHVYQSFFGPF